MGKRRKRPWRSVSTSASRVIRSSRSGWRLAVPGHPLSRDAGEGGQEPLHPAQEGRGGLLAPRREGGGEEGKENEGEEAGEPHGGLASSGAAGSSISSSWSWASSITRS